MEKANVKRALLAGLVATIVTTVLMYIAGGIGIPMWNIAGMIGAALGFGKTITSANALWTWGLVVYLVFAIFLFPLCYAHWVYSWLRGSNILRGIEWGWFFWFLQQMLVMPLIGNGLFDRNGPAPAIEIVSWLVLWTIYGAIFGGMAGPQRVWRSYLRQHPEEAHQWPHRPSNI